MAHTAADILVDVLHDWGVRVVFGLPGDDADAPVRSEEHTSELQSLRHLVCRLLLEKKKDRAPRYRRTVWRPRNERGAHVTTLAGATSPQTAPCPSECADGAERDPLPRQRHHDRPAQ